MAGRFAISWLVGVCTLLTVTAPLTLAVDVADTYSRSDDTELGVTETGGFSYLETGTTAGLGTDSAMILDEELVVHGGEGEFGSGPGIAMIDVDLADIEMSADMRFSYPNDLFSDGGINTGGFILRRPGTAPGFNATNEGQVEVSMFPAGGFFIREIDGGALNLLYDDNPFGGVSGVDYGPAGSLPRSVGGLPFDFNEDGVLDDFEQFRLGANLTGNELSVTVNGEEVVNLNVSRSVPPGEGSLVGFYKNRHVGDDGTRDVVTPVFDNVTITGTAFAAPPPPPIIHTGDNDPLTDEDWVAFNGGAPIANNGPVNDGGIPAWNIDDDSDVGGSREAYVRSLTGDQIAEATEDGWQMKGTLRFIGIDDEPDGAVELSAYLDSQIGYVLWFGADETGNPIVAELSGSQSGGDIGAGRTAIVQGAGYHDYEMVYDPSTETVDILVDGTVVIGDSEGVNLDAIAPLNRILWGSNDSSGMGNANYSYVEFIIGAPEDQLQPGDADQDFDFDQADIVRVLVGAKYLTGQAATWGEGDWNGAPGGSPGSPPNGDGLFNQTDIIAALAAGFYLKGPYVARDADASVLQGGEALSVQLSQVPEPSALLMLSLGALAFLCSRAGRAGRPLG